MNHDDNQKWLDETGGKKSQLKKYQSVQHKPFGKSSDKLIMLEAPISPLHDCKLGPVNHVVESLEDEIQDDSFKDFMNDLKIVKEDYFHKYCMSTGTICEQFFSNKISHLCLPVCVNLIFVFLFLAPT